MEAARSSSEIISREWEKVLVGWSKGSWGARDRHWPQTPYNGPAIRHSYVSEGNECNKIGSIGPL